MQKDSSFYQHTSDKSALSACLFVWRIEDMYVALYVRFSQRSCNPSFSQSMLSPSIAQWKLSSLNSLLCLLYAMITPTLWSDLEPFVAVGVVHIFSCPYSYLQPQPHRISSMWISSTASSHGEVLAREEQTRPDHLRRQTLFCLTSSLISWCNIYTGFSTTKQHIWATGRPA